MAFSPLNAGYSPLKTVTVALPLNALAGDLKPWYWLMKNSWGTTYGENAWILENGEGHLDPLRGECLAMKPSYSTV